MEGDQGTQPSEKCDGSFDQDIFCNMNLKKSNTYRETWIIRFPVIRFNLDYHVENTWDERAFNGELELRFIDTDINTSLDEQEERAKTLDVDTRFATLYVKK